nr:uncharacterized protein LOC109166481 [Ipomoea batatas]
MVRVLDAELIGRSSLSEQTLVKQYREKLESKLSQVCDKMLDMLDSIQRHVSSFGGKIFYHKMISDYILPLPFWVQEKAIRMANDAFEDAMAELDTLDTLAEELLEKIATNGTTWYSERSSQRLVGGFHDVDQISALSAKVDNMASMVQKIAQITLNNQNVSYASSTSIPPRQIMMCDLCGGEHNLGECLNEDMGSQSTMEQVDLVGYGRQQQSFQPQGAYNPNASRNHPGFSWSNPMGAANPQSFGNRGPPPGFQGQQNYRGGQQQQQSRQNLGFQNSNAQPRQPLEKQPPPNWEAMIEMMFKSQMQSEEKIRQVSDKLDQLNTIDSCVRETLEESNWISNNSLGVDMEDTIEEEQIDEDTSGFDELFDENELLVQPSSPKLEVFGLGDQLANHNGDNHPKVELKPLPSELKYVFLGSNSTYPVIVNANLNDDEIEKLKHYHDDTKIEARMVISLCSPTYT